jgi:hypothetical protein
MTSHITLICIVYVKKALLRIIITFIFTLFHFKLLAKGGAKGGAKKAGGKAAGEEVVPVIGTEAAVVAEALLRTLEKVVAPVEEVVASDTGISRSAEGAAALSADNQYDIGQVDGTQVQVGMDPHWGEAAKER